MRASRKPAPPGPTLLQLRPPRPLTELERAAIRREVEEAHLHIENERRAAHKHCARALRRAGQ